MQLRSAVAVGLVLAATVLVAAPAAATDTAPAQDDPRAEAGLDQEVTQGVSVLLDATESWSPAGDLTDYEWSIESPDGDAVDADCDVASCRLARFPANESGVYDVTLTVEDDAGGTASDTMYVESVPAGPFGVNLTGPEDPEIGEEGELTAIISRGNATPQEIEWYRGDNQIGRSIVSNSGGVNSRTEEILEGRVYIVEVIAEDGRTVSDYWIAPVLDEDSESVPDGYPRIEGPELITGTPDEFGPNWQFSANTFVVMVGPNESAGSTLWSINRLTPPVDTTDELNVDLSPGTVTISANHEFLEYNEEFRAIRGGNQNATPLLQSIAEDGLEHTVEVDPEPVIDSFDAGTSDGEIIIYYSIEDQYNPTRQLIFSIDGEVVHTRGNIERNEITDTTTLDIPPSASGTTTVRVEAMDGRAQRVSETTTVYVQPRIDLYIPILPPRYRPQVEDQ